MYDLGAFSETRLRFRYFDSTFNGWHYVVDDTFGAGWQNYSVISQATSRVATAVTAAVLRRPECG